MESRKIGGKVLREQRKMELKQKEKGRRKKWENEKELNEKKG